MQRLKPDPIPAIHPCPEHLADMRLSAVYADTKATLGVPWMGVVTMAFAHYPAFYATLWAGLRGVCRTDAFVDACASLRSHVEAQAAQMQPEYLPADLRALGYTEPELDQIRRLIEVFSAGNMPYLLIATVARLLLEGHGFATAAMPVSQRIAVPAMPGAAALTLVEPHHADMPTQRVYQDIRQTLALPFVNTDYRALARWPSYFGLAWTRLKPQVGTASYEAAVASTHGFAVELAAALPLPDDLTSAALAAAAERDASVTEVLAVVRLFQWLLPGLAANVAGFRMQMMDEPGHRRAGDAA